MTSSNEKAERQSDKFPLTDNRVDELTAVYARFEAAKDGGFPENVESWRAFCEEAYYAFPALLAYVWSKGKTP